MHSQELACPTDKRIYAVAAALDRPSEWGLDQLSRLTRIDRWFLYHMDNIVTMIHKLKKRDSKVGEGEREGKRGGE